MKNIKKIMRAIANAMTVTTLVVVGIPLILAIAFGLWLLSPWGQDFMAIDACLDRGGCWVENEKICEYESQARCDKGRAERI